MCCCFSHEHIEIIVTKDGEPVLFRQREGPFFPSLRLLHKCKMLLCARLTYVWIYRLSNLVPCMMSNLVLYYPVYTYQMIPLFTCLVTHLLTHCCAWPADWAESRSVLHIERSWPAIRAAPTDRPMSSSTCYSQFLRGRPGGRFQSVGGGVPMWDSIDSREWHGNRYRGNAAVTAVIPAGMGEDSENGALIPR